MPTQQDDITDTRIEMRRTLNAPRHRVFKAWAEPAEMQRWFAPDPGMTCKVPVAEVKPGGRYRIEMGAGAQTHVAVGTYQEVQPPGLLVFTWAWEGQEMPETLVTIQLKELPGGRTELTLVHERLPAREVTEEHVKGWNGCLARLPEVL